MNLDRNEINQYLMLNELTTGSGIVIFGGTEDRSIPVNELKQAFGMEETVFNRSLSGLSVSDAVSAFDACILDLFPESILLHIGEEDLDGFAKDPAAFVCEYVSLISHIRTCVPECRIGIVSIAHPLENPDVCALNEQLRRIAQSEKCEFCNLNSMKWASAEQHRLSGFVFGTGFVRPLSVRRPLCSIVRMLFRYQRYNAVSIAVNTCADGRELWDHIA